MKICLSNILSVVLAAGALFVAAPMATAQQKSDNAVPKYIYLQKLSLEPGMSEQFAKLEQAEVTALRAAKAPGYFYAMGQITGESRLIFFEGYDSFAQMQQTYEQVKSNAKLAAMLRQDDAAQAAMVRSEKDSIFVYRKGLSLHADQSLEDTRFMLIWRVEVKPGHEAEFENIARAEAKALASQPNVHWTVWEKMYGQGSENTFLVVSTMKSLSEIDTMIANRDKTRGMVGKGLVTLVISAESEAVLPSSEENLFALAPKMSYAPDAWLTDSPDFWSEK